MRKVLPNAHPNSDLAAVLKGLWPQPIDPSRRARMTYGRGSLRLLVLPLIVFAPTEHSLGDPIGELVLH